jgi:hypothetical protein
VASAFSSRLGQLLPALLSVSSLSSAAHGRRTVGSLGTTQIHRTQEARRMGMGLAEETQVKAANLVFALATCSRGWMIGAG